MNQHTWYPVAHADDLALRHVFHGQLNSVELALWRNDDGLVNAWENRCPHRSVRLTIGVNTGQSLRCQYHGWQYQSGDGRCVAIPAAAGMAPPASLCARTFPAVQAYGYVWVHSSFHHAQAASSVPQPLLDPLALVLRSTSINACMEDVFDAVTRFAHCDPEAVGATVVLQRSESEIELEWHTGGGRRQFRFWLQPADHTRTILHGSTEFDGTDRRGALQDNCRLLDTLRRRLENVGSCSARHPGPPPASTPFLAAVPKPSGVQCEPQRDDLVRVSVTQRWMAADGILALRLTPAPEEQLVFSAGAHIDVHTPSGLVRQYSLLNAPRERADLVIGVKREPMSRGGSRSLHDALKLGDTLLVSRAKNHFSLVPGEGGILIAGGIGITPILAMGAALDEARLPYTLHYFVRSRSHAAFPDRLAQLSQLRLHTGLDAEPTRAAVLLALREAGPHTRIYACGPAPLIAIVKAQAEALGIGGNVIVELFSQSLDHGDNLAFRVRLLKSATEFEVPADVTLAQALKLRGMAVDTSCEQGVCGSCRTGVVDGEVEHRDVYLSEQEKQRHDCLMPCVSRGRSALLTLDL